MSTYTNEGQYVWVLHYIYEGVDTIGYIFLTYEDAYSKLTELLALHSGIHEPQYKISKVSINGGMFYININLFND